MTRAVVLVAALFLASLVVATPAAATHTTWHIRCSALTDKVNQYRSPDLRLMGLLCRVGHQRAYTMAVAGSIWHSLAPVKRALSAAGVCWKRVGEVIAWNNYAGTASAFIRQWRRSPAHWDMLMGRGWDRGGGSWVNRSGLHVAVYYTLDVCGAQS